MINTQKDLAIVTIDTAPSPATSGTTFKVLLSEINSGGSGSDPIIPTEYPFQAVITPGNATVTRANSEIVTVESASDDATHRTYTVTREQGEPTTTARTIVAGDKMIVGLSATDWNSIASALVSSQVKNEVPGGLVNSSNTTYTTATAYQTGSLRVYQNGIRLKGGGVDYTETSGGFTMVTAPVTSDILLVDYDTNTSVFATGSTSFIYNETPSGTVNGSNTSFTLAFTPVAGTLMLFRDGQLLVGGGEDYTLATATITFVTAPVTDSVLKAYYQKSVSVAGNADTLDGYHADETPMASTIPVLNGAAQLNGNAIAAPQGFLLNGKIVPSVASNNLTVAIKGLDGNDPSTTNPVFVRIGDTIRTITAALSVTKNAGTNWCNAGSSELATKEIDYFVYLGYNATDGVTIGFSRIPYAGIYSDFSTTTTDERYCAISTITNAVAGNNYEVVGRFGATLSATASFNWSVPTFTNVNLIQRPIYETRWLEWVPTITGFSVNPAGSYRYSLNYRHCDINFSQAGSFGTSNSTSKGITLPIKSATLSGMQWGAIINVDDNGTQYYGKMILASNSSNPALYPGLTAANWTASGNCRINTMGESLRYAIA